MRLSRTLRGGDLVARLGGDEFAVISSIGDDTEKMMALAQRMIAAICAPYSIGGQNISIGASIGIAVVNRNCAGSADILRYSDMALYRAKNEGRNRACIYDAAMDADLSNRKLHEADLREAIENDRLRVQYQPIVDKERRKRRRASKRCAAGRTRRAAKFRRANSSQPRSKRPHRRTRRLGAAPRLPRRHGVAETDGCRQRLASTVPPQRFRRDVEHTLAETKFDPARLELELTESVLLGNVDTAEAAMNKLRALGVRLALDDFRHRLFEPALFAAASRSTSSRSTAASCSPSKKPPTPRPSCTPWSASAAASALKVTAEGVETADQQLFLRAAGVHFMQGYRFGKAMPAAEITARLQSAAPFTPIDAPAAKSA